MATPAQIKLIHILKHAVKMDDSDYRETLQSFGVSSSTQLDIAMAASLISKLEALGIVTGVWKNKFWKKRWDNFADRPGMATPAQLRHLEGLWVSVSRQPTLKEKQAAFNRFLLNRFSIGRIEWIESEQVGKIKRTLIAMVKQKEKEDEMVNRAMA